MPNTLDKYHTSAALAATVVECAAESGVDAKPIAMACGLDPTSFGQLDKKISVEGFCRLLEALAALTGDQTFGLKAGAAFEMGTTGLLGYGMMNAPTVGDALDLLVEYLHKVDTVTHYTYTKDDTEVILEWTYSPLLIKRDQYVDLAFVIAMAHFKPLLGPDINRIRCEMERPKPSSTKLFKELICNNIYFKSATNALHIPSAALSRENPRADPRLFSVLRMQFQEIHDPHQLNHSPAAVVRGYVAEMLGKNVPTLLEAAALVGMSERTLQRRLTEAGTSLQEILDQCRHELAEKLLLETEYSLSEISAKLGFSASSAFTRSAIRWFGETPSKFRQKKRSK